MGYAGQWTTLADPRRWIADGGLDNPPPPNDRFHHYLAGMISYHFTDYTGIFPILGLLHRGQHIIAIL
jgi:hypothetical protein